MIPLMIGSCAQGGIAPPVPTQFKVVSTGVESLTVTFATFHASRIDWGDGTVEDLINGKTHTYTTPGEYSGTFYSSSGILDLAGDALVEVNHVHDGVWALRFMAQGGTEIYSPNLVVAPPTLPPSVTTLGSTFKGASSFNGDISGWDVSNVTGMSSMFMNATSFNGDISGWDVSNVIQMSSMFRGATSFNRDLSAWSIGNVPNMFAMFYEATAFNGDISGWDVGSVTDMSSMFYGATAFNGDISGWDVSNVRYMNYMFMNATSFNRDLSGWCVTKNSSKPVNFDFNATAWVLPKPIWGTCPNG